MEDRKAELRAFKVFYVLAVPGEATVLAGSSEEAAEKLGNWDVQEHVDHELDSDLEIEQIEEVRQ
jgi:hypothetical protein